MDSPYTISVVCTGNICRSPMAEVMRRDALEQAGVTGVVGHSAGTADWHVGGGADRRAEEEVARSGLALSSHSVSQFTSADLDRVDLVLALDHSHVTSLRRLAGSDAAREKIRLLRSFDAESVTAGDLDVNDPYYGDYQDFEITFDNITAALPGIVDFVTQEIATDA